MLRIVSVIRSLIRSWRLALALAVLVLPALVLAAVPPTSTEPSAHASLAGQLLIADNVDAVLYYNTQTYFTHTYVKGAGYNSLYDYNWVIGLVGGLVTYLALSSAASDRTNEGMIK